MKMTNYVNISKYGEYLSVNFCEELINMSHMLKIFLGDMRGGGTPDPIPNSEVKPSIADGTAHESVEE